MANVAFAPHSKGPRNRSGNLAVAANGRKVRISDIGVIRSEGRLSALQVGKVHTQSSNICAMIRISADVTSSMTMYGPNSSMLGSIRTRRAVDIFRSTECLAWSFSRAGGPPPTRLRTSCSFFPSLTSFELLPADPEVHLNLPDPSLGLLRGADRAPATT